MYKKVMDASFKRLDPSQLTSAEVGRGKKDLPTGLVKGGKRINATQPPLLFCHSLLFRSISALPLTQNAGRGGKEAHLGDCRRNHVANCQIFP